MVLKIAIVGAVVNGPNCADFIREKFPDVALTIFAEKLSPGTTSDGAAKAAKELSLNKQWKYEIAFITPSSHLSNSIYGLIRSRAILKVSVSGMLFCRYIFRFLTFFTEDSKLLPYYLEKLMANTRKMRDLDGIAADFDDVHCSLGK